MKKLVSYQFDGGYASFANGSYSDWHYYIQDYMGNVRMVVNRDGTVEQKTHYYPYGGVIGDISTNHSFQKYKFEGKVLAAIERAFLCSWREDEPLGEGQDRSFGLDWYDIHARQYDAIGVPAWNKVDALAEKYYHLSPYVFAGGNPVNYGDYNGLDTYKITNMGVIDYTIDDNQNSLFIGGNQMYLNIGQSDLLRDLFINQQKNGFGSDAVGISSFSNGLNTKNSLSLFEFICDNTEVEWSLYSIGKGKEGYFQLGTTNNVEKCPSNSDLNNRNWKIHYHPDADGGTPGASFAGYNSIEDYYYGGDMGKIVDEYRKWTKNPQNDPYKFPANYIYHNKVVYFANPWEYSWRVPNGFNGVGSFSPMKKKQ